MRKQISILLASTNQGKIKEMTAMLETLPVEFVTLKDIPNPPEPPEETGATIEENAELKARYYAEKTGMIALADDTGIYIDALDGWPGVHGATIAPTDRERCALVLERLHGVPKEKRTVTIRTILCLYDPMQKSMVLTEGSAQGFITDTDANAIPPGFCYDPIVYAPEMKKTWAELTIVEKNAISHRGRALNTMKYRIYNIYGGRHIVVPVAIIVQDGKILMSLRNDPHRPEFHKKWEFPGGSVDVGETMEENIKREAREEIGVDIHIKQLLQHIHVVSVSAASYEYQVYIVPYICEIVSGSIAPRDEEVLETRWLRPSEILELPLVNDNKSFFRLVLPEITTILNQTS